MRTKKALRAGDLSGPAISFLVLHDGISGDDDEEEAAVVVVGGEEEVAVGGGAEDDAA